MNEFRFRAWAKSLAGCVMAMIIGACAPMSSDVVPNANDNASDEPQWQLVLKELPAALLSVSGTSPTNVVAVGADPGDGRGPYVLRFDGQEWQRMNTGATGDLWWISETMIHDSFYLTGEGGLILRFDPEMGLFEKQTTPGMELLFGVWGADSDSIWAVGGDFENPDHSGVIWRFNGTEWVDEDLSAIAADGIPMLFKIWGRSENEVYAVGFGGMALRYDGTAWSQIQSGTDRRLISVHGNLTSTVAVGGFGDAVILELEGDAFVNRAKAQTPQLNGVFISPDGQGVAVGIVAAIAFRTASGWEVQSTGLTDQTRFDFHAAWVDTDGGIWAVGGNIVSDPLNQGILAHYSRSKVGSRIVNR